MRSAQGAAESSPGSGRASAGRARRSGVPGVGWGCASGRCVWLGGRASSDLVAKLLVFAAGKAQAGKVEHLSPGQLAGDRHDQVRPGLNPDDGRRAGPADYSRGYSRTDAASVRPPPRHARPVLDHALGGAAVFPAGGRDHFLFPGLRAPRHSWRYGAGWALASMDRTSAATWRRSAGLSCTREATSTSISGSSLAWLSRTKPAADAAAARTTLSGRSSPAARCSRVAGLGRRPERPAVARRCTVERGSLPRRATAPE